MREHVGTFFRRPQERTGRRAYVRVPELHAEGERYHLHFAVGRHVHRGSIEEARGHGFVWIHLLGHLPRKVRVVGDSLGELAEAARDYLWDSASETDWSSPPAAPRR